MRAASATDSASAPTTPSRSPSGAPPRHPGDLVPALWTTAEGFGDVDTTCAVVGGIVAARTGVDAVPEEWLSRREALPGAA